MDCDILIAGAGPAGLALARALSGSGLTVVLAEPQPLAALAAPMFDGREIALTHGSARILRALDGWRRIPREEIVPLREARVRNGASPFALRFGERAPASDPLGWLVPNHRLRGALFEAVRDAAHTRLRAGAGVAGVRTGPDHAEVTLTSGERLRARLLVAADSRFSRVRDLLGIGAEMHRLGRSMLVCRVRHPLDHGGVATEWFDHHQTLAMLPLAGGMSSAVLTLPASEIERIAALDDAALGVELSRRLGGVLGPLEVASSRHVYPLVTSWAHRFAAQRAALIGDAAVGMHPVTAHGFNLGLAGARRLADLLRQAALRGNDPGDPVLLRRYARGLATACRPLYLGTNLLVRLYTDERHGARAVRHAGLRLAARLPLVRPGVRALLTH